MYQGIAPNGDRDFEISQYTSSGLRRIRQDFLWEQIEPRRGEFHFEVVQGQVDAARAAGLQLTALLAYGTSWATGGTGNPDAIAPEDFANFAGRVAQQYCTSIKSYEIWNEPDLAGPWPPAPNPTHYGRLLKAAFSAIKRACPDAQVILGGLSSYSRPSDRWWFLRSLSGAHPDICAFFDGLGLHPYTFDQRVPPELNAEIWGVGAQSQVSMTQVARAAARDGLSRQAALVYRTGMALLHRWVELSGNASNAGAVPHPQPSVRAQGGCRESIDLYVLGRGSIELGWPPPGVSLWTFRVAAQRAARQACFHGSPESPSGIRQRDNHHRCIERVCLSRRRIRPQNLWRPVGSHSHRLLGRTEYGDYRSPGSKLLFLSIQAPRPRWNPEG